MKHKGFSLIEMLVTIGLIVILSLVSMLSIKSLSASADARRIINNLQIIKAATLAWYNENSEKFLTKEKIKQENRANKTNLNTNDEGAIVKIGSSIKRLQQFNGNEIGIYKYLEGEDIIINANDPPRAGEYCINASNNNGNRWLWFVGYHFKEDDEYEVKEKIKGIAGTYKGELRLSKDWPWNPIKPTDDLSIANYVWLQIFRKN